MCLLFCKSAVSSARGRRLTCPDPAFPVAPLSPPPANCPSASGPGTPAPPGAWFGGQGLCPGPASCTRAATEQSTGCRGAGCQPSPGGQAGCAGAAPWRAASVATASPVVQEPGAVAPPGPARSLGLVFLPAPSLFLQRLRGQGPTWRLGGAAGARTAPVSSVPSARRYRSFLRPRYKVAHKTVSDLEWRCCQGYSGEDCSEGPAQGPPLTTTRPRPRPGRPTLSGFGNQLSGLGGEGSAGGGRGSTAPRSPEPAGGGEAEKVQQLEEKVRRLSKQLEELQASVQAGQEKLLQDLRKVAEGSPNGKHPPADAAPPDVRETLSHIQQHLERLDDRIRSQELERERDGFGGSPAPEGGLAGAALLRELEQRVQDSCSACLAGTEGLRRQQAEDRERMRALEKLVSSVDQRNREAVETVQRHVSSLSTRLAPAAPPDELRRRVAELERRLDGLEGSRGTVLGPGPGPGPVLARRLSELEGRLNATRAGPGPPDTEGLRGHMANLSRALEGLAESGAQRGARLAELEGVLARCGRPCPEPAADGQDGSALSRLEQRVEDNEAQLRTLSSGLRELGASGAGPGSSLQALRELVGEQGETLGRLAGRLGQLEAGGSPGGQTLEDTRRDLEQLRNRTGARLGQLEAELQGLSTTGACAQPCSPLREELERLREEVGACTDACGPPAPDPTAPDAEEPLEGFSVFGGTTPWELQTLQGELSEALLFFGLLNTTVQELQDAVDQHDAGLRELGAVKDRLAAELDRVQAEVAERAAESEERLEGLVRDLVRAGPGGCPAGLEPRVAKLEGVCEQLEVVSGGLRGVREGLGRHVAGLWNALRELNGTARTHSALLEKAMQLPNRLGALNASFQQHRAEMLDLTSRDLTGARRPREQGRGEGARGWGEGGVGLGKRGHGVWENGAPLGGEGDTGRGKRARGDGAWVYRGRGLQEVGMGEQGAMGCRDRV
uniref:Elastin microfibril interfacer 1 n=1 Tax=Anser cygnoides TaxID=8845 RepID=A0A8B9E9Y1_ANSCY